MKLWKNYHTPTTTDEAVALLTKYQGQARVIAGGTDLLIDMRAAGHDPQEALVDITTVREMCEIREEDGTIYLGGGVTHTQIVKSEMIAQGATCLVESCGVVGGPQVRNVATLGGNVVHALPAGDGTTSLVVLDAEAEIIKDGERKWVSILEMYLGPGKSLLDSTRDMLVGFRFAKTTEGEGTAFKRIMRPQGVALPVLGCSVWVKLDDSREKYESVRICLAPVGPTPRRAVEVEGALMGQPVNDETLALATDIARRSLAPRTSKYRATADYRQEMIDVLLRRTLPLAVKRAQTGEVIPEEVGLG